MIHQFLALLISIHTGVSEDDAQAIADDIRVKINEANASLGSNVMPLARAFGAH